MYDLNIGRDGCWFCPNYGKNERALLKSEYPELVEKIYAMIDKTNIKVVLRLRNRNTWIAEYLKDMLEKEPKEERQAKQLDGQMNIFDLQKG